MRCLGQGQVEKSILGSGIRDFSTRQKMSWDGEPSPAVGKIQRCLFSFKSTQIIPSQVSPQSRSFYIFQNDIPQLNPGLSRSSLISAKS
ncbi:hypothetical protein I79_000972 [Cricetulus griseus]|uniref:Uncharacterized protein n=1 Tax=Cricetulus griseus TaxID=10029 RepID=G3GTI8_CRIGR|nr:hypothetical protein I79_000972 [Cricetulus griseus]